LQAAPRSAWATAVSSSSPEPAGHAPTLTLPRAAPTAGPPLYINNSGTFTHNATSCRFPAAPDIALVAAISSRSGRATATTSRSRSTAPIWPSCHVETWQYVETLTASSSANLTTSSLANYSMIRVTLRNIRPATDDAEFRAQLSSDGATFLSTGYDGRSSSCQDHSGHRPRRPPRPMALSPAPAPMSAWATRLVDGPLSGQILFGNVQSGSQDGHSFDFVTYGNPSGNFSTADDSQTLNDQSTAMTHIRFTCTQRRDRGRHDRHRRHALDPWRARFPFRFRLASSSGAPSTRPRGAISRPNISASCRASLRRSAVGSSGATTATRSEPAADPPCAGRTTAITSGTSSARRPASTSLTSTRFPLQHHAVTSSETYNHGPLHDDKRLRPRVTVNHTTHGLLADQIANYSGATAGRRHHHRRRVQRRVGHRRQQLRDHATHRRRRRLQGRAAARLSSIRDRTRLRRRHARRRMGHRPLWRGTYGTMRTSATYTQLPRYWSLDKYGQYLLGAPQRRHALQVATYTPQTAPRPSPMPRPACSCSSPASASS
jgi:hypothetical protein